MTRRTRAAERPRARVDGLLVKQVAEETVVYDLEQHRAHCLNAVAAAVWRLCDGRREVAAIARQLDLPGGAAEREAAARAALVQLGAAGLLDGARVQGRPLSRRRMIARFGQAAALPVVLSIVSPTPAQAATPCSQNRPGCVPLDAPCRASSDCCSCCCKDVGGGARECKPGGGNCLP